MSDNHKVPAVIEKGEVTTMHPLVKAAITQNPAPGTLRELLAVQREWEAEEAKKAFTRALVALKRDLPAVINRDKTVDFTGKKGRVRYTHTSLAAIMEAITGPITNHGFSVSYHPSTDKGQVTVACRLTHAEGHSEEAEISAPIDTSGNKSPAQGVASTITLLSRYACLALLGIATADMQDPSVEPAPATAGGVDHALNLKAAGKLKKYGKTREEAEEHLGRKIQEWTRGDLDKLRAWLVPEKKDEPGHDPETGETSEWDGVGGKPLTEEQVASMRDPGED